MLRSEYLQIVNEYFDVTDNTTRRCLLSINEADQNQVMASLANKLYNIICKKATEIDFGLIPNSKGNINNIPNFIDIWNALETVRNIIVQEKKSTDQIDSIIHCIENLQSSRAIWEKGFALNNDIVCMYYNTMALSIVSATSIYIASAVEFVKNPSSQGVDIELVNVKKNKSKDGLLFTNIAKFNKAFKKEEIQKTMNSLLSAQKTLHENGVVSESVTLMTLITAAVGTVGVGGTIAGVAFVACLITLIIPMMHQLTVFYYHMRVKLSEYLELEAQIILLNAEAVKYDRSKSEEEKKKIIEKQRKIAEKFNKASDKIAIKSTKAEKEASAECSQNEKNKIDDVVDSLPDSSIIW